MVDKNITHTNRVRTGIFWLVCLPKQKAYFSEGFVVARGFYILQASRENQKFPYDKLISGFLNINGLILSSFYSKIVTTMVFDKNG